MNQQKNPSQQFAENLYNSLLPPEVKKSILSQLEKNQLSDDYIAFLVSYFDREKEAKAEILEPMKEEIINFFKK